MKGDKRPYIVIVPGGGFNRQWGFIEGEAVAARFNRMGYHAFVLYYRTKQEPCLNLALNDMVSLIKDIEEKADSYHIKPGCYIIGGFSAGATMAAYLGTDNFGWRASGIPKPGAIFLGYPAVGLDETFASFKALSEEDPKKAAGGVMLRRMAGPLINEETVSPYMHLNHMSGECPPTLITACEDDATVPVRNSYRLKEKLESLGIPVKALIGHTGGHSFGLGIQTEVESWPEEVINLYDDNLKDQEF